MKTLIINANLMTMTNFNNELCNLLIEDNKIAGIYPMQSKPALPQSDSVIDAQGLLVTPGFIDAHCHAGMIEEIVGDVGDDVNEMTSAVTPELRGIDGVKPHDEAFADAIRGGVTTVCTGPGSANVIGGTFCILKTYGKTVLDMVMQEEYAMKMALGENPKRVYGFQHKSPSTRMASAAILREWLIKARNYKDKWDKYYESISKAKTDKVAKPEFDMKLHSLMRVFNGMPVKIHCHQADDICTAIRICKEFGLTKVTLDHCTEGWLIPDVIKNSGFGVIIGPTFTYKSKVEVKNKSFLSGRVLLQNGIKFSVMTDHPVVPLEYTTSQLGLFVKYGLPPTEALKAVTINAAEAIGMSERIGSIEVGKEADLVIWSGDPLHYATVAKSVFIGGKMIYHIN
ncbi:MAG: amidohydrolase family protein [Clostridia bacterium]|nr:amidohydrolase family protein [Clostridia bacterium]